jgi:hypothetical protein
MRRAAGAAICADLSRRLAGGSWLVLGFMLCALPVGLIAAVASPPGTVQDEAAQLVRAAALLHGQVFAQRRFAYDPARRAFAWEAGVEAPVQIAKVVLHPFGLADGRMVARAVDMAAIAAQARPRRLHLGVRFFFYCPNTALYFPLTYVPAALGLLAGAVLAHGAPAALLCARLACLAMYLAMGALALGIAAYGEAVLLAVLLLPFSLYLAGSVNQDGMLVGLAVLGVAAVTRGGRWRWLGLAALSVLAAGKPTYLPLIGLAALPLRGAGWPMRAAASAAAALLVAGLAAYTAATVAVAFDFPSTAGGGLFYHPGPLYAGDRLAWFDTSSAPDNLRALLAHPAALLSLPWRTLAGFGWPEFGQLIGRFGTAPPPLAGWFVAMWGVTLVVALAGGWGGRRAGRIGLAAVALAALALWLTLLGLYLSNTPVGMLQVEGFRPRYLLPLLPVLALLRPTAPGTARVLGLATVLAMGVFDLGYVPATMLLDAYSW